MFLIRETTAYIILVHLIPRREKDADSVYFFFLTPKFSKLYAKRRVKVKTLRFKANVRNYIAGDRRAKFLILYRSSSSGRGRKSFTAIVE